MTSNGNGNGNGGRALDIVLRVMMSVVSAVLAWVVLEVVSHGKNIERIEATRYTAEDGAKDREMMKDIIISQIGERVAALEQRIALLEARAK